jgi:polysaccharide export outer membrane protein
MYRFSTVVFLLLATLSTGPTLAAQSTEAPGVADIRLAPGDQLRITVWRKPELSGDFVIAQDGTVGHPLYREVQVAGLLMPAVEDRLRTFLTKYETNPQFVILPLIRVVVAGEVRQPNLLAVPPGTTVTQAVVLGGGPTERGRLDRVQVVREGHAVTIDLTRPGSDEGQIPVRSGDQIVVERRGTPMRDFISPIASSVAAIAAIVSVLRR